MHVRANAVELDGALEELPVRGMPVVILAEDLQLRSLQRGGLELSARGASPASLEFGLTDWVGIPTN